MQWVNAKRDVTEWEPVVIDCPACRATSVAGIPRLYEEPLMLLGLIPLFTLRSAFVECTACRASLTLSPRELDTLSSLKPDEIGRAVRPYISGVGRFFVIAALLLFWFPFGAPLLALAGLWMTRRHPRWRKLAIAAVVLTFLVAAAVATLLIATRGK